MIPNSLSGIRKMHGKGNKIAIIYIIKIIGCLPAPVATTSVSSSLFFSFPWSFVECFLFHSWNAVCYQSERPSQHFTSLNIFKTWYTSSLKIWQYWNFRFFLMNLVKIRSLFVVMNGKFWKTTIICHLNKINILSYVFLFFFRFLSIVLVLSCFPSWTFGTRGIIMVCSNSSRIFLLIWRDKTLWRPHFQVGTNKPWNFHYFY